MAPAFNWFISTILLNLHNIIYVKLKLENAILNDLNSKPPKIPSIAAKTKISKPLRLLKFYPCSQKFNYQGVL